MAYARLTSRPRRQAFWLADPENKAFTFKVVQKTNYGQIVFTIIYTVNVLLSMVLTVFLLPSVFAAYDTVANRGTFLDNPSQVQLMVIALLASLFMIAIYISEVIQLCDTHGSNPLTWLKFISSILILTSCLTVTNIHYVCCQPRNFLNILKMCGVTLLSAFIFTLIRDIFPTILVFFAFSVDTFALLALHVALFYTETMVGTLVVCQSHKFWKTLRSKFNNIKMSTRYHHMALDQLTEETEETELSNEFLSVSSAGSDENSHLLQRLKKSLALFNNSCVCMFSCVLGVLSFCVAVVLFYLCMMWFFQLLILRNLGHNTAFSVMIKYVPTAAIGLFGFVVGKSTLIHNKADKDGEIFWMKLGELLNFDEEQLHVLDEEKRAKIRNLKRAFKQNDYMQCS